MIDFDKQLKIDRLQALSMRLTDEYEQLIRSAINPIYADQIGTESYERKTLMAVIDYYREQLKHTTGE